MGTGITDVIGGPHDFLPLRSDEFQKLWDYEMCRVPGMLNLIFVSLYQQLLVVCRKYDSSQRILFKQIFLEY